MTGRLHLVILCAIAFVAPATLRGQEAVVPAGTVLQCTLSESNLSSKTAERGDPILCDVGSLHLFGVSVLPRGAYLEGHFTDFKNPGHFWGKGWMQLDFDQILLPGAQIPLSTKVTSIPHLGVDAGGKIHGNGHARRDAVEWAIPPLWPVKILTLPMRGPRPTLKGEARVSLKLMQDLSIPEGVAGFAPDRRQLRPGAFRPGPDRTVPGLSEAMSTSPPAATQTSDLHPAAASEEGTALILRDGESLRVRTYRFEAGQRIRYHAVDGTEGLLPIQALDLVKTVKLNQQHGVEFVISSDYGAN
jgi:hypothetical protein